MLFEHQNIDNVSDTIYIVFTSIGRFFMGTKTTDFSFILNFFLNLGSVNSFFLFY
jgi:hypothetical protein